MVMEHHDKYFEGILQLRNPTNEVVRFVKDSVDRQATVHIARAEKVRGGIDFYLSSNRYLVKIGKILQTKFGGEIKRSSKLHSVHKQTSKLLYRGTILFRMPSFVKGDTITFKGEKILVIALGKRVVARNVASGKKYSIKYSEVREF